LGLGPASAMSGLAGLLGPAKIDLGLGAAASTMSGLADLLGPVKMDFGLGPASAMSWLADLLGPARMDWGSIGSGGAARRLGNWKAAEEPGFSVDLASGVSRKYLAACPLSLAYERTRSHTVADVG
jgi:hypothetical protein